MAERAPELRDLLSTLVEGAGFGTVAAATPREVLKATCTLARVQAKTKLVIAGDQLVRAPWPELITRVAERSQRFGERVGAIFIVERGPVARVPEVYPCEVLAVVEKRLETSALGAMLTAVSDAVNEGTRPPSVPFRPSGIYRIL